MPIYEYRCSSCGHELEALQKLSDQPLVACPACQKDTLVKLISAAGFQLKGTGWYVTDFRGSSGSKSASTSSTSSSESKSSDSKPQGSSDAAPAASTTPAATTSTTSTSTTS